MSCKRQVAKEDILVVGCEGRTHDNEVLVFLMVVLKRVVECLGSRKSWGLLEGSRNVLYRDDTYHRGYALLLGVS